MTSQLHVTWNLLVTENKHSLTDEQIEELLAAKKELLRLTELAKNRLYEDLEELQRYRARKKELQQLPTEELQNRYKEINSARSALAADTYDELGDSFFESPHIDSDEHILFEILEEQKKTKVAI